MLSSLSAKHHKGEMTSIFDGKTLNGWSHSAEQLVTESKMVLLLERQKKEARTPFYAQNKLYGDFELKFEVKLINNELNSGVQIRSNTKALTEEEKEKLERNLDVLMVHK